MGRGKKDRYPAKIHKKKKRNRGIVVTEKMVEKRKEGDRSQAQLGRGKKECALQGCGSNIPVDLRSPKPKPREGGGVHDPPKEGITRNCAEKT